MKVLHIISGLGDGGAEGVLYRLCTSSPSIQHYVVSLTGPGKYGPLLRGAGVKVTAINLSEVQNCFSSLGQLFRVLRREQPSVVQTWMYHADLIGGVIARLAGFKNIIWNVRHSELIAGKSKRSTLYAAKLCALVSGWLPKRIICCGEQTRLVHARYGYNLSKMDVIQNGFDLDLFCISHQKRYSFRRRFGISDDELLLACVGRFNSQKNHFGLIEALFLLKQKGFQFKCIMAGKDIINTNEELVEWISDFDLSENVYLVGSQSDIPELMNGVDINILASSFGEGFPNVVAEAMACGTPCVVTDVGDSADIVDDAGWVVPPDDSSSLAGAISEAIMLRLRDPSGWSLLCHRARERISINFSLAFMTEAYSKLWRKNS